MKSLLKMNIRRTTSTLGGLFSSDAPELSSARLSSDSARAGNFPARLGSAHEILGLARLVNISQNELAALKYSKLQQNLINSEQNFCLSHDLFSEKVHIYIQSCFFGSFIQLFLQSKVKFI